MAFKIWTLLQLFWLVWLGIRVEGRNPATIESIIWLAGWVSGIVLAAYLVVIT